MTRLPWSLARFYLAHGCGTLRRKELATMICTPETTLKEFLTEIYAPLRGIDERTIIVYSMTIKPFGKFLG